MRRLPVAGLVASLLLVAVPAPAHAGTGSPNTRHVAHLAYELRYGMRTSFGSDIEFARIRGRDYALAGTYRNGLQIVDITNPRRPRLAAVYDCGIAQGDVQVFRRGSRTLATYTADDAYASQTIADSTCYREARVLNKRHGTFIVDVTNPRRPTTVSFVDVKEGSHNQTVHPSGRYLYNSNADARYPSAIEIFDISNLQRPRSAGELPLGTGIESHDITFSADGKRAYAAALSHSLVIDTTDAGRPQIIGRIIDPAINIHHQSDPVTVTDPLLGRRTFLVVTDELAGAAGNGYCPGGGLHVYDISGERERTPVKVGFWSIPEVRPAIDNPTCTSHVLRFYPKQRLMTIAWFDAGVRVVDISGLAGVSVGATPGVGNGGAGMREIGYYTMPDANTWSAKTNRFDADGSFYLFGNDMNRGLDVYRFDAKAPISADGGTWMSSAQALAASRARGAFPVSTTKAPMCVVRLGGA